MLTIGMQWAPNSALLRSLETADSSKSTVMSTKSGPIYSAISTVML